MVWAPAEWSSTFRHSTGVPLGVLQLRRLSPLHPEGWSRPQHQCIQHPWHIRRANVQADNCLSSKEERPTHVLVFSSHQSSSTFFCNQTLGGCFLACLHDSPSTSSTLLCDQTYPFLVTLSPSFSSLFTHLHPPFFF